MDDFKKLKDGIEKYIAVHGKERVANSINEILGNGAVSRDKHPIINNNQLQLTVNQLDAGTSDILEAGEKKEEEYKNKADLLKEIRQLQTEIELAEAEAIMEIRGESSRSQYIIKDGEKVAMTNDTARDAYMATKSAKYRRKLAEKEAELARIDAKIREVNDKKGIITEGNEGVRAKAGLQAALLKYLSNGGS